MSDMRMRCAGYFDERVKHLGRISKILDDIENGTIERPEFEIETQDNEEKSPVFIAALFRESPEAGLEGWFIWKYVSAKKKNLVYCKKSVSEATAVYKSVLLSGASERVHSSAILTKCEVISMLSSLMQGTSADGFDWLSFASVVAVAE